MAEGKEDSAATQCEVLVALLGHAGVSKGDTEALIMERVVALIEQRFDVTSADSVLQEDSVAAEGADCTAAAPPPWLDELIAEPRWSPMLCTLAAQHRESRVLQYATRRLAEQRGGGVSAEEEQAARREEADEALRGIPSVLGRLLRERLRGLESGTPVLPDGERQIRLSGLTEACAADPGCLAEAQALLSENSLGALPARLSGALPYLRHARALTARAATETAGATSAYTLMLKGMQVCLERAHLLQRSGEKRSEGTSQLRRALPCSCAGG